MNQINPMKWVGTTTSMSIHKTCS